MRKIFGDYCNFAVNFIKIMGDNNFFYIDVREILNAKVPETAKKIPGFVVRWLSKLIWQDEVNQFLKLYGHTQGVDFMNNAVKYFEITLQVKDENNLPGSDKPCIFVSNHPLGGLDGICLASYLGNRYGERIRYLVNDILYFIRPLQSIFLPVNKHGSQGSLAARKLNEAFNSENQIITFPAGLCSRKIAGKIQDLEWKKMFITKAVEHKRDIVPVYFEGKNSNFFYNLANLRKRLKIKFNIEMLFLPRELFKAVGSTYTIHFGEPIPWQTFDASKNRQQWADWVKNIVYNTIK
jgi:1-acyl-sn-glycerol-3-phosphate acyltransferase